DEPGIVRLLETNLVDAGYQVVTAPNGREALRQVAAGRPDLVVLDDVMPGLDGSEVLRALKNDPSTADLPVVAIASRDSDADVWREWQNGADVCVTKPVNPRELLAYLNQI